jgi:hypothetical protein
MSELADPLSNPEGALIALIQRRRACQAGHRVAFATATDWVARLADAHHAGQLPGRAHPPGRYPLLVVDEVGYIRSSPKPPTCSSGVELVAVSCPPLRLPCPALAR